MQQKVRKMELKCRQCGHLHTIIVQEGLHGAKIPQKCLSIECLFSIGLEVACF